MSYLGRKGAVAPLTSADIPVGIVEGTDIAFLENASGTQNLGGTYSTERMYLNDSYTLTGDVTITGHLALGTVADSDVIITQDSTERTITGSGTLESGEVLSSKETDLTGMTGTLDNSVQDNITRLGTVTSGTLGSGVTIPRGAAGVATVQLKKIGTQSGISTAEDSGTLCTWENATLNVGGHWDNTSNRFKAPQTGIYRMGWGGAGYSGHDTVFRMYIWINGSKSTDGQLRLDQLSGQYFWGSRTGLFQLSAGDYVDMRLSIDSSVTTWYADGTLQTYFNIEFLG